MFNPSMTQDMVGLRFLFGQGQFLGILIKKQEAKALIKAWLEGKLGEVVGTADLPAGGWAIRVSSINAIHEFSPQELQQAAQQQQIGGVHGTSPYNWGIPGNPGKSGFISNQFKEREGMTNA